MTNGRPIPYGHFLALTKVNDSTTRESLINQTIANCWIRDELQAAILELNKGESSEETTTEQKKEDGRGRPLKTPKDLPGLLRQQQQAAKQFVERSSKIWETPEFSIIDRVKQCPSNEITEEQVTKLWDHAVDLRDLAKKASLHADQAELAAEQLQKKLTESQQGQEIVKISDDDSSKTPNENQPEPANLNVVATEAPNDQQSQIVIATGDDSEPRSEQQSEPASPVEVDSDNPNKQQTPLPIGWSVTINLDDPAQKDANSPFSQWLNYRGNLVVTFKQIDWWHGTENAARKSFYTNRNEFVEGVHYVRVPYSEWRKWNDDCDYKRLPNSTDFYAERIVLTLRGYLLVIKPFQDERAWDMQRVLSRAYMFDKNIQENTRRTSYISKVQSNQVLSENMEQILNARFNL